MFIETTMFHIRVQGLRFVQRSIAGEKKEVGETMSLTADINGYRLKTTGTSCGMRKENSDSADKIKS